MDVKEDGHERCDTHRRSNRRTRKEETHNASKEMDYKLMKAGEKKDTKQGEGDGWGREGGRVRNLRQTRERAEENGHTKTR